MLAKQNDFKSLFVSHANCFFSAQDIDFFKFCIFARGRGNSFSDAKNLFTSFRTFAGLCPAGIIYANNDLYYITI